LNRREHVGRLLERWPDGRIKQHVLASILRDRRAAPSLYAEADYQPLEAMGAKHRHILAFRRSLGEDALIVVVSRLLGELLGADELPSPRIWADMSLRLPAGAWRDVITGQVLRSHWHELPIGELFASLPVAVLRPTR
jgi:(1->4)-alpha-D-glucan 1-alpha-D-glucosylmutase